MSILLPIFALFLLTLVVLLRMALLRLHAVKTDQVSPSYFRLFQGASEPDKLAAHSRNYINLLESPTLFYVICLLIYVAGLTNIWLVGLAWLYVALRCLHSWIHLHSNHVLHRFRVFASSIAVLSLMWMSALFLLLVT